ncbi:MAG: patatin [Candidatus Aegiribacteria sp.]|nr:patatin [Candidatus Aegiribacteria sp.]MBD3294893.1 patatin [Candidatus Fermentibacteria bacterium]
MASIRRFLSDTLSSLLRKTDSTEKDGVGLALGGGSVLGAAHIGVLRSLQELDIEISAVAGTSIGAMIGAFFAFGKGWEEIRDFALDLDWMDVSKISLSKHGLLSNKKMGSRAGDFLGEVDFADASIPLRIVACDIATGEKVVFSEGKVSTAIMASTCIPAVFVPVKSDGRLLVDGGIVENVPISPLKEMDLDMIIGVDLNAKHSYKKPDSILDVVLNALDITLMNATHLQTKEADLLIAPDLSDFNMIDTDQAEKLIEKGYEESKPLLEQYLDLRD